MVTSYYVQRTTILISTGTKVHKTTASFTSLYPKYIWNSEKNAREKKEMAEKWIKIKNMFYKLIKKNLKRSIINLFHKWIIRLFNKNGGGIWKSLEWGKFSLRSFYIWRCNLLYINFCKKKSTINKHIYKTW